MARSATSKVISQLISETRISNDAYLCTEQIPVETSKGTISRAMIDAIDRFVHTGETKFIIELIKKAKETNYIYTKMFALSASHIQTKNGEFKVSFDVQKGQLCGIKIFIKQHGKRQIQLILTALNDKEFTVKSFGNGSDISNQFLEAAKEIFTACQ